MPGQLAALASIEETFAAVAEGHGSVCLLQGGSGMGKTHVARAFLDRLPRSTPSLSGGGIPTGTLPMLPICQAISSTRTGTVTEEVRTVLAEYGEALPVVRDLLGPLLRAGRRTRHRLALSKEIAPGEAYTFCALVDLLRRITREHAAVLFLDDVQWLDASSISFLGHLLYELHALPLLVLLAGKTNGQAAASVERLQETIARLPYVNARSVELLPLGVNELPEVAATILGGTTNFSRAHLSWLERVSRGNPKYLAEALTLLRKGGHLVVRSGAWVFGGDPPNNIIPPSFGRLVIQRLRDECRDGPEALDLIRLAAVVGRRFDARTLAAVEGKALAKILSSLSTVAGQTGYVHRLTPTTVFEFDHDLTRDALLADLGEVASDLHAEVARVLARTTGTAPQIVAFHFREARDSSAAATWYELAANRALAQGSYAEAGELGLNAYEMLRVNSSVSDRPSSRLLGLSARALFFAEEYQRIVDVLGPVLGLVEPPGRADLLRWFGRANARLPTAQAHQDAVLALRAAADLGASTGLSELVSEVWADLVYAYDGIGEHRESQKAFRTALRMASAQHAVPLLVRLYRLTCIFLQPEKVVEMIRMALPIARQHRLSFERAFCWNNLGTAYLNLGRIDQATSAYKTAQRLLLRLGGWRCDAPENNLGVLRFFHGDLPGARTLFSSALAHSRDRHNRLFIRSNRAVVDATTGRLAEAIDDLTTLASEADEAGDVFYRDCLRHNLARALLLDGRAEDGQLAIASCPVHVSIADQSLVSAKRARLLLDLYLARSVEPQNPSLRAEAELLDRTTKPQAWLYRQPWYVCDIEFWED
jgi:tetratricopeptide (TPR) repeat protein